MKHIVENSYRIGADKLKLAMNKNGEHLLVQLEGRWERFAPYIIQNKEIIKRRHAAWVKQEQRAKMKPIRVYDSVRGSNEFNC